MTITLFVNNESFASRFIHARRIFKTDLLENEAPDEKISFFIIDAKTLYIPNASIAAALFSTQ